MHLSLLAALGSTEILLIFAAILLLFGGTKLPQLARGLGQSVKEFKKAQREDDEPAAPAAKPEAKKTETTTSGSN